MEYINGRSLKLAPDSEAVDLIFVECREVGITAIFDLAGVGPGAPGDEIEHRAFAGAIRANDDAQLAFIHVECKIRDGLEPIERLVHLLEHSNKLRTGHDCWLVHAFYHKGF